MYVIPCSCLSASKDDSLQRLRHRHIPESGTDQLFPVVKTQEECMGSAGCLGLAGPWAFRAGAACNKEDCITYVAHDMSAPAMLNDDRGAPVIGARVGWCHACWPGTRKARWGQMLSSFHLCNHDRSSLFFGCSTASSFRSSPLRTDLDLLDHWIRQIPLLIIHNNFRLTNSLHSSL